MLFAPFILALGGLVAAVIDHDAIAPIIKYTPFFATEMNGRTLAFYSLTNQSTRSIRK